MSDLTREQIGVLVFLRDYCREGIGHWTTDLFSPEGKFSAEGDNEGDSMTSTHADLGALRDAGFVERRPFDHSLYVLTSLGEAHLAALPPKPLFVGLTVRGNYLAPGPGRIGRAMGIPLRERSGVKKQLEAVRDELEEQLGEGVEADIVRAIVVPAIGLALTACELKAGAAEAADLLRALGQLEAVRTMLKLSGTAVAVHGAVGLVTDAIELIRRWI